MKITSRAEKRNLIFLKGDWGQFDALHCSKFSVGRMACGRGEERERIIGETVAAEEVRMCEESKERNCRNRLGGGYQITGGTKDPKLQGEGGFLCKPSSETKLLSFAVVHVTMPARFTTSTGPFFSANFVGLIHRRGGGEKEAKKVLPHLLRLFPRTLPLPMQAMTVLYIRYMMQVYPSQRRWGRAKETFFRIWGNVPCHRHMRRQSTLSPCLLCIGKYKKTRI